MCYRISGTSNQVVGRERPPGTPGTNYTAYMTGKHPPRLRFKPGWRTPGKSIQWYPTEIEDDLDRETSTVPQVIVIKTHCSIIHIQGFRLEKLVADLNRQVVVEIWAYCSRRWPGAPAAADDRGEPKPLVTKIGYHRIDGRTNHGKALRQEMALVPEGHVDGPPEEMEVER